MPGNRPNRPLWCVALFLFSIHSGMAAVRVLTPTDYLSVYSPIVFDAWQSREQYASIRWEFDDTTVLYGPMAEHRYTLPGHHLVLVETTAPNGKKFAEVLELNIGGIPAGVDLRVVGAEIFDPPPTGDANGMISPGEWASVRLYVANFGTQTANRVTGQLILPPEMLSQLPSDMHNQTIHVGDIGPMQTVLSNEGLAFAPPQDIKAPNGIWFYLLLEDLLVHRSLPALSIPLDPHGMKTYEAPFGIEGTLTQAHPKAVFYFNAPQTSQLTIGVSDRGGPLDPYAILVVPDGRRYSDDDSGYGDDALIVVPNAPEGKYQLEIGGAGGTLGAYVIAVDVGDSAGGVGYQSIAFGQTITGTLGSSSDLRTFTFFAHEGQRIEILLTDDGGTYDPFLVLQMPITKESILDDDGGPGDDAQIIVPQAPSTGIYTILVMSSFRNPTQGFFRLVLAEAQAEEFPISLGQTVSGEISRAGNVARYFFTNPDSRYFRFTLDDYDPKLGGDGKLDPYLKLFDINGNFVASDDNNGIGDDAILVTRMTGGVAEVSGGPFQTTGPYRLHLEEGQNIFPILQPGITSAYVFSKETETFEFFATAGSSMYIYVTDRLGSLDPAFRVFSPGGYALVHADNSFPAPEDDAHAFLTVTETGTYRLEIYGAKGTFGPAWITFNLLQED